MLTPRALWPGLFEAVQEGALFADSKTFVDAIPRQPPASVLAHWQQQRSLPGFDLRGFVQQHFELPAEPAPPQPDRPTQALNTHIAALWQDLRRHDGAPRDGDSRIALPLPYVVPGGRFRELYYWDSHFTLLGLLADGQRLQAEQLVANFAFLLRREGRIPNGARSYYRSRSQPPVFASMLAALRPRDPAALWARQLDALRAEYRFWMRDPPAEPGHANARCVRLLDGSLLNRYSDDASGPREESWREDQAAAAASGRPADEVYAHLRAAAESGWDFSSRWCAEAGRLASIETQHWLPVDLNAWLWQLESALAAGAARAGQAAEALAYRQAAQARRAALQRWLLHPQQGWPCDWHWREQRAAAEANAAMAVPLALGLLDPAAARATAAAMQRQLLAPGGLLTTPRETGEQWDAPNGWAPLQWLAFTGLRRYGHTLLATTIAERWLRTVRRGYRRTGLLLEKYDVLRGELAGGGEYPLQQGFGWTNGVQRALAQRHPRR